MTETRIVTTPMSHAYLDPEDSLERQNEKLIQIVDALVRQVERGGSGSDEAYAQFRRAALLEEQVQARTAELETTLEMLNRSNARLAQAMRETEAARRDLSTAIETVQEGFAMFDPEGVMVMCNSRFGMHMDDIRDTLAPGLRFADYIDSVARSRALSLPPGETPEIWRARRLARHDDRHAIFNISLSGDHWVQISQHRTPGGGTVILQTDVTDMIRAERQARERMLDDQSRMARATLDHIKQGICIFDGRIRLAGWNDGLSQLMGVPMPRLRRGLPFPALWRMIEADFGFDGEMTRERLSAWVETPLARQPLRFAMRSEDRRFIDASAQQLPDGGFVISFTDITAERRAIDNLARANEALEERVRERTLELEDALERAERANASRSRFVAATSHDLLQPLSAANLFLSALVQDDPANRAVLGKAHDALHSVEAILHALLDISKLELGHASMDVGPVALDLVLGQLRDQFALQAEAKGIGLRILPCALTVTSDRTYLKRVLQNLIGNALRYTETGRVLVGTRRRGGAVAIEVWDTGPGIAEEDFQTVFREFARLNARASASEGMGLGLAIVERACAILGHPLDLASEPGRYTRFSVTVPVTEAQDRLESPAPASVAQEETGDRVALLVENDAELRRAMCHLLERWGVTVLDVDSGEAALALIAETGAEPDLLLVDQQLGRGLTGLDTISALRELLPEGVVRPVRLVTADRSPELREAARRAGVTILPKPVGAEALRAVLDPSPGA
ncbi:PAS-domain containing protein [Limimaricola variabilis]|nr:PAS-domain containing protein [Limimaricola variabilis]WPY94990.1 PAS-domain containing protein [Limimaricola variabilis]